MKVELAKMAGFCFGVNRAVDTVYQEAVEHLPVYTYGPIIHNEEVVKEDKKTDEPPQLLWNANPAVTENYWSTTNRD